ncbi:hypothetical protein [Robiginitalea sediminis]|uniref:hypothetical protein n=1 Tax=Robiginitalea sediminis TaxID=1982593 RepID=UPI000B4C0D49|nr:hypothetical protein [Robiginitalea sediminis]
MSRGGVRPGAGRKSKAEEQELVEKLSPLEPIAFKALTEALSEGQRWAVRLYFEYMYGRPAQQVNRSEFVEQPLFGDIEIRREVVYKEI